MIAAIAPNNSRERFTGLGVRVIEGEARFTDAKTVAVGDQFEIKARRFVIATGSRPAVPPIPGLDNTPYLTNETVFEMRERPKHLIVIGAGAIGLELAQAFRRLGSDVTVLEAAAPLAGEDPECAAVVLDALAREGVTVRSGVTVTKVKRARNRIEVELEVAGTDGKKTIEMVGGSDLLVAAGRRPAVEGLGLDAAGINFSGSGIHVDKRLRTTNKQRLCHWRRYRIGAFHPRRQPPRRAGDPPRAVSFAGQGRSHRHPAGDLHRSRTGACRTAGRSSPSTG